MLLLMHSAACCAGSLLWSARFWFAIDLVVVVSHDADLVLGPMRTGPGTPDVLRSGRGSCGASALHSMVDTYSSIDVSSKLNSSSGV